MTETGLELREVIVRYGDTVALDKASLVAEPGAVTGLVGPNGAGKTTTLKLAAGLVRPQSGQVRVAGLDPCQRPTAARRQLTFLPDRPVLPTHLSARELLLLRGGLYGLSKRSLDGRIESISAELHLAELLGRWCGALSHGQAQRLALAAVLLPSSSILLVDEPMTALDLESQIRVREALRRRANDGVAVMLTTHTISHVSALADEIIHLGNGRVIAQRRGTRDAEELENWLLESST
ncbi:MAG: ABC transporter ATP-binding protein [bacterium]|nr:ABC transporter ATP-binding protein [bacterium]